MPTEKIKYDDADDRKLFIRMWRHRDLPVLALEFTKIMFEKTGRLNLPPSYSDILDAGIELAEELLDKLEEKLYES